MIVFWERRYCIESPITEKKTFKCVGSGLLCGVYVFPLKSKVLSELATSMISLVEDFSKLIPTFVLSGLSINVLSLVILKAVSKIANEFRPAKGASSCFILLS